MKKSKKLAVGSKNNDEKAAICLNAIRDLTAYGVLEAKGGETQLTKRIWERFNELFGKKSSQRHEPGTWSQRASEQ